MNQFIVFLIVLTGFTARAQEKSYLIVESAKSYGSALRKAQKACNNLGVPLNLAGNIEHKETGLTNNDLNKCGKQLGYIPRHCEKPGNFLSIEHSRVIPKIRKDLYLVVLAHGETSEMMELLTEVQTEYKKARIEVALY